MKVANYLSLEIDLTLTVVEEAMGQKTGRGAHPVAQEEIGARTGESPDPQEGEVTTDIRG